MARLPSASFVCAALAFLAPPALTLSVTGTAPCRLALGVSPDLTEIRVSFDEPPAFTDPAQLRVSGSMSGIVDGSVNLEGAALVFTTDERFIVGELVSVNLRNDLGALPTDFEGYGFAFTIASGAVVPKFDVRASFGTSMRPYFIHGGDLDGDGVPDVAAPNEDDDSVSIFLNTSADGTFDSHEEFAVGSTPSSIFGEDLDNDGDIDLATADITSSTMSVLLNDGTGTFTLKGSFPAGSVTRQVHGGDLDGDNDVDVVTTSNGDGGIIIFYNQGDASFQPLPVPAIGDAPFAVRCADLDGDGHLDIAVANRAGDDLTVLENNGSGAFTEAGRYSIGDGPWCLNGNDLDGDGSFDLVSVASGASQLVVLLNDGAGAFPSAATYPTGSFPLGVFAADLDGDGDVDATSSNFAGASVDVFLNDGDGVMSLLTQLTLPMAGTYTWAHDVDGDGDLDLTSLDEVADSLFVYYNDETVLPVESDPGGMIPSAAPTVLSLGVWPNPGGAGGSTRVRLGLPAGFPGAQVEVYGVGGRRVAVLGHVHGDRRWTELTWDGNDEDGSRVASGRYLIVARAGEQRVTQSIQVVY